MSNIIVLKDLKNIDGIQISDDEFIASAYRKVTINSPLKLTPLMTNTKEKILNLFEDIFYKISINLGAFSIQNHDDGLADEAIRDTSLNIYSTLVQGIVDNGILTEEEVLDDVLDIQKINDKSFFDDLYELLIAFALKLDELTKSYFHA
jgi:hypothetical protein